MNCINVLEIWLTLKLKIQKESGVGKDSADANV
jgi:hypothetical protein